MRQILVAVIVAIAMTIGSVSSTLAVTLVNPGFDAQDVSGGDAYGAIGWGAFNFAFTTQSVSAHSAPNTMKLFGPFFPFGGSGVVQGGFSASPGELWEASAWARIDSSDPMHPSNFAVVKLEFLDAGNNVVGFAESPWITTGSLAMDTWKQFSAQGVAPANTATAQIVLVHVQLADPVQGGAIFFDDAAFGIVPEPASALLGMIGLICSCGIVRRRALC